MSIKADFKALMANIHPDGWPDTHHSLLCIDPGPTTGWAFFQGITFLAAGQIAGVTPDNINTIEGLLERYLPQQIVMENYQVYPQALQRHMGSDVPTLQILGVFKHIASTYGIPVHLQGAMVAKKLITNAKLREWDIWEPGKVHAQDAIRHGVFYLLTTHTKVDRAPKIE